MAPTQTEGPRKQDDKDKLEDEVRLRHFTEEVLDSRQEELEVQERENSVLSRKLESLQQELKEAQRQLALARSQSTKKNKAAEGSKDQNTRPAPRRKDITEAEAQEAYRVLCDNVQRWVEQRIRPVLDDLASGHFRCQPSPSQSTRFVSLLREPATSCLNVWHSDEYHFMALIMQYLWLVFFSRSFYCPLDDGDGETTAAWLDDLESAIAKLPRDISHCREWRAETLTALTSQKSFKSRRAAYLNHITEDLASLLSVVVPYLTAAELQGSLRTNIIDPAADLAHRLQLSPDIYTLKWPARTARSKLDTYECINLASNGETIGSDKASKPSEALKNASYLFDIAPGLFVETVSGAKKSAVKVVCRPKVLVYGGEKGGDIPQQAMTLARLLWDYANGSKARSSLPLRNGPPKSKPLVLRRHRSKL
ncbi:hypothetical protein M419DRAFT_84117 [Trichoderma reesei RUT C-30]|uniref:Uncharacterized protein n=1 Tax=Hypocrea jecorina (strain ATCC 56765 / BCRC 32924 / NRRL 11460 / Rut C-30) TaxID=1344414 RepID=A0A024S7J1_HYPJR|nr:hypothetical protein M419DRAFT_84117 [Trichoderma reesei RUT C-30]